MESISELHLRQNRSILKRYTKLEQGNKITACYVWIDGSGINMRSKLRTLDFVPEKPEELPIWEFDGSSTQQAVVGNSDLYLYPRAIYRDPFRPFGNNKLVLCEVLDPDKKPAKGNNRSKCLEEVIKSQSAEPWFGFEQEYVIMGNNGKPIGWPTFGYPPPQGPYYCSIGYRRALSREIPEALYSALLYSGVSIYGDNAEVLPSQWEFQIGTCEGINGADELWISRYILNRIAEDFSVSISFDPKPIEGSWNGTGCHTNFSTNLMRQPGGITHIYEAIKKLEKKHAEHLLVYDINNGKDNIRRLCGSCETASYTNFTYSVSGRSTSIRINRIVDEQGRGYFEDRRPAGNCDPYLVTAKILNTIRE